MNSLRLVLAAPLLLVLGCDAEEPRALVQVQWLEVAASDYKLELEPSFDPSITSYAAQADGPGIEVYVDVIVDADVSSVLVNGVASTEVGFRTWRSADGLDLLAPTSIELEIVDPGADPSVYEIEITVP